MTKAFVLSGGGNLGAVQVGMLRALRERRIVPDFLVGTSVGALNAAYLAGRGMTDEGLDELARMWRRVRRKDIFPFDPFRQMLAVTGRVPSLYSNDGLRRLIAGNVGYRQLQDAAVPIHLVAANMLTGEGVCLSTGNAVSAVLASAAIPAVFPAVERDGMMLCDGGIAANAGVSQAVDLGADEIYLLPSGYACALARPPRSALGTAVHALSLLLQRHVLLEVTYLAERVDLHVLPPLCPVSVSPLDFSPIPELIERGYRATSSWLAEGGDRLPHPERFLSFHDHGREHDPADDAIGRREMAGVESAHVLPQIVVSLSLKAARLPVATAARLLGQGDNREWPPNVLFDGFAATLREFVDAMCPHTAEDVPDQAGWRTPAERSTS